MYIRKVNKFKEFRDETKKIKIVTWIIFTLLFLRGIDILMVFIAQNVMFKDDRMEHDYFLFFNIFKLVFYFLETGPALVLLYSQIQNYWALKELTGESKEYIGIRRDESSIVSRYTYSQIVAHQQSRDTMRSTSQSPNEVDYEKEQPMRDSTNSLFQFKRKYIPV